MISVVIPMYNSQDTILNAINGVVNQTRYDLIKEIIVINDGSTDDSLNIVEQFKEKNNNEKIMIVNKKNGGVSSARNLGIEKASAEWIALLDSDDYWKVDKIEKQILVLKKYPDVVLLGTGRNKEELTIGKNIDKDMNLFCLSLKNILFKVWPHTSTVLINRKKLLDCSLFDIQRKYSEDAQLWLKIASKYGKIHYISESLEIAGDDKPTFGYSGLSSNLDEMHKGCIMNINECLKRKDITIFEYLFFYFYEILKYKRRKLICRKSK